MKIKYVIRDVKKVRKGDKIFKVVYYLEMDIIQLTT